MKICTVLTFVCLMLWMSESDAQHCGRRQFACADGTQCIYAFQFCDGRAHCRDHSDEKWFRRSYKGLRCRKGRKTCVLDLSYASRQRVFCDNVQKAVQCKADEFKCNDGSRCVKLSNFCNGKTDCRDGSDEQKRGVSYDAIKERPCKIGNNICVLPLSLRSKRQRLCDKDHICWDEEFKCENGKKCIPWHWFCDGDKDCKDGIDEISLPSDLPGITCHRPRGSCLLPEIYNPELFCQKEVKCLDDEFKCRDGTQCIPWRRFCSGHKECKDGSDEGGVNSGQEGISCRNGRNICILPYENEDMHEKLCLPDSKCREDEFACTDGNQCIPWSQYCDGTRSCRDGSDEININSTEAGGPCRRRNFLCLLPEQHLHRAEEICDTQHPKCNKDEYSCISGTQCIPVEQFCDGSYDCRDLSDEIHPKKRNDGIPCKNQRRTCVLPNERSDLQDKLCSSDRICMSGFRCADGKQCIPTEWFCDGKVHCKDGSDEINVRGRFKRRSNGIRCPVGKNVCLLPAVQAFKRNAICRVEKKVTCRPNEFKCRDNSKCLKASWFCDGESYCRDKSDSVISKMSTRKGDIRCRYEEHICVLPKSQNWKKRSLCKKAAACNEDEFMCNDGSRCLPGRYYCDGYNDCSDGSDEISPSSDVVGVTCRGIRNSWIYSGGTRGTPGGNWCVLPETQKSKKKHLCNHWSSYFIFCLYHMLLFLMYSVYLWQNILRALLWDYIVREIFLNHMCNNYSSCSSSMRYIRAFLYTTHTRIPNTWRYHTVRNSGVVKYKIENCWYIKCIIRIFPFYCVVH